jgi:hypothetical protein
VKDNARLLAPDLPSNRSSGTVLKCTHSNYRASDESCIVIFRHYLDLRSLGNLRACCLPWMWMIDSLWKWKTRRGCMFKGAQVWDFDVLDFNAFYHEVSIGRGLEGFNKSFTFFTDGWDTGHFFLANACAVYASKLLPHAPHTLAKCYRMRRIR